MLQKIAIILLSLLFLGEISVEESEPNFNELEIESFAFVNNPNGIQLYTKAGDFKSKTSIMRYQEEFELYGSSGEEIKGKSWRKVKFQKKEFFILESDEFLLFEQKDNTEYALVQEKDLVVYEKPFKDAKVIGKLEQFDIVNTSGLSRLGSDFLSATEVEFGYNQLSAWYKVTNSKQITGFILNGIGEISTIESIEQDKAKKALSIKGVCELTSKSQNFYSDEKLNKQVESKVKKIFQAKSFVTSGYSFEKDKVRYFQVNTTVYTKKAKQKLISAKKANKKRKFSRFIGKYNAKNFEAYISEKDCKFFTDSEYSDYTASHSRFSGDRQAMYAMKRAFAENYFYLDYTDFKLIPLNPKSSKSDSYFLAIIPPQNLNSSLTYHKAILLAKKNGKYETVTNSLYPNIDLIDIDKDGILELIVRAPMRGDTSDNNIFLFQKGNFVSINSILPKHERFYYFQDNEIYVEKNIYNKDGKFMDTEEIKYKYQNRKLIKVK